MTSFRRFDPAGLVAGILLLLFAALIIWDMNRLQIAPFYGVGPKAMPYVVSGGLALLGLGNLALAASGGFPARESLDVGRVFVILGGLVALIGTIAVGMGFVLASTFLFAAVTRAFEEEPVPRMVRLGLTITVGLLVAAVVLRLLGLALLGYSIPAAVTGILVIVNLAVLAILLFSRRGALNLAIGFALGVVAYLLFAKLLALTLPAGPLEQLL
jgi:putative tricarboxylic transport membrane protein